MFPLDSRNVSLHWILDREGHTCSCLFVSLLKLLVFHICAIACITMYAWLELCPCLVPVEWCSSFIFFRYTFAQQILFSIIVGNLRRLKGHWLSRNTHMDMIIWPARICIHVNPLSFIQGGGGLDIPSLLKKSGTTILWSILGGKKRSIHTTAALERTVIAFLVWSYQAHVIIQLLHIQTCRATKNIFSHILTPAFIYSPHNFHLPQPP